jgi:hypothetical protein
MMSCKEYIFRLTSGQLAQATGMQRFWAAQHRLMCRRCRAFTHNDRRLTELMGRYRRHILDPDARESDAG